MKIFITGNLGYVGAELCKYLRKKYPQAWIAGYDLGYFQQSITTMNQTPESYINVQYYGDVRKFDVMLLNGFDHVVHLAAISNDPIGNKFETVTLDVNYKASINMAKAAIEAGVKSFVFASSCSVYGAAGDEAKTESSTLNPLTAYAKSKVFTEQGLAELDAKQTSITCLRFATACGLSDRLRLDLVLNDFVTSAFINQHISILSDGTPWRPLIHVKDMARAIDFAMQRQDMKLLICNTGANTWNYTVKQLAETVQSLIPNTTVEINTEAPPDKRSYRVNFDLFEKLAGNHNPQYDLRTTILELQQGLKEIPFPNPNFRTGKLIRLNVLNTYLKNEELDLNLNWINKP